MARPAPGPSPASSWQHVPNAVSVSRIVLVLPVALTLLLHKAGMRQRLPWLPWTGWVVVFMLISGVDCIVRWGHKTYHELGARDQRGRRDES